MKPYEVIGVVVTVCILAVAFSYGSPATALSKTTDQSDVWSTDTESGWGIEIVQQNNTIFATMYVYGPDGQPTWYTATLLLQAGTFTWSGELLATTGPWFGSVPFNASGVTRTFVGNMTFTGNYLNDLKLATLTYTVNGVQVVKQIKRFLIAYEDYTATYSGVMGQQGTGLSCNPVDNFDATSVTVQINQIVTAMTIVTQANGNTCTFPGTYSQAGHFGQVSGNYVCTNGDGGTFVIFEMTRTHADFRARTRLTSAAGCTLKGRLVGLEHPLPPQ